MSAPCPSRSSPCTAASPRRSAPVHVNAFSGPPDPEGRRVPLAVPACPNSISQSSKIRQNNIENLAKFCNFLAGSFSAVSKPIFANKYAFGSICRHFSSSLALQDLHTLSPKSLFAQVLSSYSSVSASFCCRVIRVHSFLLCGSVPHFFPHVFSYVGLQLSHRSKLNILVKSVYLKNYYSSHLQKICIVSSRAHGPIVTLFKIHSVCVRAHGPTVRSCKNLQCFRKGTCQTVIIVGNPALFPE